MTDTIHSPADMERLVSERGFLPFFAGEIADFSIEERTPPEFWFPEDTVEGVWEWKGPVIVEGDCAYGKFYLGKACFVSMELFPDFVNYRRSLYQPTADEQLILQTLQEHHSLLSKELKRLCGYVRPRQPRIANPLARAVDAAARPAVKPLRQRRQSFDTAVTRLQMAGRVVTADFEYSHDREGRRYGWGVARYCTPEDFFGPERMAVSRTPEESRQLLLDFLARHFPQATEAQLNRVVG